VKSWPNVHNTTKGVGLSAGWHCNCPGTFSWCSYTTCYAHCDAEAVKAAADKNNLAVAKPAEEKALTVTLDAQNHEWDCNCQGLYDVCSLTTCTYTTKCGGTAAVKSWPNVHNTTKGVGLSAGWHCNCPGTFSWCSYTTCYAHCDAEAVKAAADKNNLAVAKPAEEKALTVTLDAQNHEWDCNCQGLFDVCSLTTCTYTTQCGGAAAVKSWPNAHNTTTDVSVGAEWHCNCAGTFSWCSYTTCYAHCDVGVAEISI